ncbi:related to FK506-binding protein 3 [Hanseniaspora guilliermondii]|uniref:FK506-binding protein n=1 Tax=Hanseniaspora guilliermondii TaxID=56406 RepID=A0A1L0FNA7_9ASCO|nr:related to FK506-binding protein 3 [Hanseniaspora guilliermondii]
MEDMVPLAVYGINVIPGEVTNAIDSYPSATVKITSVAVHPESLDGKDTPTTLIMLKKRIVEDEENSEAEDSDNEENDNDDEGDEDEIIEEFVVATLSPEGKTQQTVDLIISPDEDIAFVATGSYRVDILGNYVTHPYDFSENEDEGEYHSEDEYSDEYGSEDDEVDELDSEDDELDSEDEAYIQKALEDIEDSSDVEGKIHQLIGEVSAKRNRATIEELPEETEEKPAKETKKQKKEDAKKVAFKKDLVEGPSTSKKEQKKKEVPPPAPQKPKAKQLEGGVIIEDRTIGKGKQCKKGDKVGMRYIGKLKKNEKKVFDKNVKGKPFVFNLGKGDVIKGWDIGVAGMAVGGERRIIIPAAYAYGKTALPGIPANSDLIFDVKLVSMK